MNSTAIITNSQKRGLEGGIYLLLEFLTRNTGGILYRELAVARLSVGNEFVLNITRLKLPLALERTRMLKQVEDRRADMPREGTTVEAENPARVISTDIA